MYSGCVGVWVGVEGVVVVVVCQWVSLADETGGVL